MTDKPVLGALTELLAHLQMQEKGTKNLSDSVAWLLQNLLTERMEWASSNVTKAASLLVAADLASALIDEFIAVEQGKTLTPSCMSAWSATSSALLGSQAQNRRALIQRGRQFVAADFYASLSKSEGARLLADSLKETCLRLVIENPISSPNSSEYLTAASAFDRIADAFSKRIPNFNSEDSLR